MFAFAILDGARRQALRRARPIRDQAAVLTRARAAGSRSRPSSGAAPRAGIVDRELDRQSLFHYLSLRFVPGERSIFAGVERLPPGHCTRGRPRHGELEVRRWWRLEFEPERGRAARNGSSGCARPCAPRSALDPRRRADRVLAVGRTRLERASSACSPSRAAHDLRTYTLGFTSDEDERLNELPLARALAERYGTEHHELVVDADELLDDLLLDGVVAGRALRRRASVVVRVPLHGRRREGGAHRHRRRRALRELPALRPVRAGRLARLRPRDVRRYHFEPSYYFSDAGEARAAARAGPVDDRPLLQRVFDESGSGQRARLGPLPRHLDAASGRVPADDRPLLDGALARGAHAVPRPRARRARRPRFRRSCGRLPDDPKGLLRDAVADC